MNGIQSVRALRDGMALPISTGQAVAEARLTSKGRVTIPRGVRKSLGLEVGDRVRFVKTDRGCVILRASRDLRTLRGILKGRRSQPATIEDK